MESNECRAQDGLGVLVSLLPLSGRGVAKPNPWTPNDELRSYYISILVSPTSSLHDAGESTALRTIIKSREHRVVFCHPDAAKVQRYREFTVQC